MKKRNLLLTFHLLLLFSFPPLWGTKGCCQISLGNNYFPLAGSEYNRFICIGGTVGNPGAGQQYDFSGAMVWANDTLRYINPATTGFSSFHPGSGVAMALPGEISVIWYYTADSNAYWTSGGTLIGDFGQGMTVVHANHPAPYVDTLVSDEYSYGHTETEISGIRFQNLSPGVDYQTISGKYIAADGWGTLYAPLDTFNDVLRVKYIEFKYDTVFANNVPVDSKTDTLYYYKYFAQGVRHPVVIAYTDTFGQVKWMEIIHFPDTLFGCTDTAAENYNPLASGDNGSCLYCTQVNYGISQDTGICRGDSVTLLATGATNFLWSTGDSAQSITVAPDSSKTYSVYLSNQSYCWELAAVTIAVSEEVQAGFWADPGNPSDGDTILFVNTSVNASGYSWDFGDSSTSADKNPKHLFNSEGPKTVMLIAYNECSSDTFYMTFTIAGKKELTVQSSPFSVYPNPSDGKFIIRSSGIQHQASGIRIVNILGEIIFQSTIINQQSTIDISGKPKGIYIVQLQSEEKIYNQKIIVD